MRPFEDISAPIPDALRDADELLTRYGRWAMLRHGRRRCGSAEGRYAIPPNDDDRTPREVIMPMLDALAVQRALSRVPDLQRIVLSVLYIPHRIPSHRQLQMLRIPPRLSRDRHITGLRMFANLHRVLTGVSVCGIESRALNAGRTE